MCALLGVLCCKEDTLLKSAGSIRCINEETRKIVYEYEALIGKRKRRALTIPKDCLYGKTKRGTMTYNDSNVHELYDPEYIIENSKIFDTVLENYGSYEAFVEDTDSLDKFMNWYFPDDIPDEWSRADQEKSHGCGVNQLSDKPLFRRYFMRYVDLKSNCMIWDKETIVCNAIQQIQDEFDDFYIEKKLLHKYNEKKQMLEQESNVWNLRSLKYILSSIE